MVATALSSVSQTAQWLCYRIYLSGLPRCLYRLWTASSCSNPVKSHNGRKVGGLFGVPKVVRILHGQPAFRRAAYSLGQAQRHFRCYPAAALEDTAKCGWRHIKPTSHFPATNAKRLKIDF